MEWDHIQLNWFRAWKGMPRRASGDRLERINRQMDAALGRAWDGSSWWSDTRWIGLALPKPRVRQSPRHIRAEVLWACRKVPLLWVLEVRDQRWICWGGQRLQASWKVLTSLILLELALFFSWIIIYLRQTIVARGSLTQPFQTLWE